MTIERMTKLYNARQEETAKERERSIAAIASVAAAELAYDQDPSDKVFARLRQKKEIAERAARNVVRAERLEKDAHDELRGAEKARDLAEIETILFALRDRPKAYAPHLSDLVDVCRDLVARIITPLEKKNDEFVKMWERANELSVRVGSIAPLSHSAPRPRDSEVLLMARVIVAELGGPEHLHRYLEGYERPAWADPALPAYEAIKKLVDATKEKETEAA